MRYEKIAEQSPMRLSTFDLIKFPERFPSRTCVPTLFGIGLKLLNLMQLRIADMLPALPRAFCD